MSNVTWPQHSKLWILCFAALLPVMPSWGQGDSVIRDGKEWLQPVDFVNYDYHEVNAVCPGGACSGKLPGNSFDLTGYTWASASDVSSLFNSYGVTPPLSAPFQVGYADNEIFCDDFSTFHFSPGMGSGGPVLAGMIRDVALPNEENSEPAYVSGMFDCRSFSNPDDLEGLLTLITHPENGIIDRGVWFWRRVGDPPSIPEEDFIVLLEEPIKWETHSGIGNLRGWAVAEDGIDRVEIYIDGEYVYDAPFGGERLDVADQYPDFPDSDQSGFSLAFGYSNLGVGEHTVAARAVSESGESKEDTSTFTVEAFEENFISNWEVVDTSQANIFSSAGNQMHLEGVRVDGVEYIFTMIWRAAEQGFELVDIARPIPTPGDAPVTYFGAGEEEGSTYSVCLNLSADATQLETNQSECAGGSSFDLDMVIMSPGYCEIDFRIRSYEQIPIVDGGFAFNTDDGYHISGDWVGPMGVSGYVQPEDAPCVGVWSASSEAQ